MDVEIDATDVTRVIDIGEWLDANMPNPPVDETQRWTFGYDRTYTRLGIRFSNERDATLFTLRWGAK